MKIYNENGSPFVTIKSNLCERPLKCLLDTGASISLVSNKIVSGEMYKIEKKINVFGIMGKEVSIKTEGIIIGVLNVGNYLLTINLHVIEGECLGSADALLGYDLLAPFKTLMNMNEMYLEFNLGNFGKFEDKLTENRKKEKKEPNFLEILAENYEFEIENKDIKRNIMKLENLSRSEFIYGNLNLKHCGDTERKFVKHICNKFPLQFYVEGDLTKCTNIIKHKINLIPGAKPVFIRQYRIPEKHIKYMAEIINDFEAQGIIEKCQSNFNSPAMLVPKKGTGGKDDYRFVVDYRKLNMITEVENFPIPIIDDILNGLSGCEYFSTMDLKGGFYQLEINRSSRNFTAFSANNFQYRFCRLPMGLSNSPAFFQRCVNTILEKLIGKGVYVYLDDVIVYSKTLEEHNKIMLEAMELLKASNLQLKIEKCIFYAKNFEYLGHIVSKDGMKANPKKVEVIRNFPRPINIKQIQSFLGLCNYFRRYVKDFSKICKPLTTLLKKELPFLWTDVQQRSFEALKKALAEEVTLAFPNFEEIFYVTTDASDIAIGGCLSQFTPPNDRPIYFFSRTLSDTQRRYSTIEKELLAIVESIKAFRVYLYGRFFILITDHKPLVYLFNMRETTNRLFRSKMELMDYNFKIIYKPGHLNKVSDALSRIEWDRPLTIDQVLGKEENAKALVTTRNQKKNENVKISPFAIEEKKGTILRKANFDLVFHLVPIENDVLKNRLVDKFGIVEIKTKFCKINNYQYAISISNQFANKNNEILIKRCVNEILGLCEQNAAERIAINLDYDGIKHYVFFQFLLQESFKSTNINVTVFQNKVIELQERDDIEKVLDLYHNSVLGGHVGAKRMENTISQFYKWKGMSEEIKQFVKKCPTCERTKVHTNVRIPMEISSQGSSPFDHVYIDFVGPINPPTAMNNRWIFSAVCDLTKMVVFVPTPDATALTAAKCLLDNVILKFNFPSKIISDNAASFLSKVITELTNLFSIKKIFTTPYHPQSNIVERQHRSLNAYLRAFTAKNRNHWDELLKFACFVYNNTVHSTTGFTPNSLVFGYSIDIPNHLTKQKVTYNYENLADIVRNNIARSVELAKEHLLDRKLQNKHYYDKNAGEYEVKIDDMVLVKRQVKSHKFDDIYEGPFKVTDTHNSYVEIMKKGKKTKIHKNLIKKAGADHSKAN